MKFVLGDIVGGQLVGSDEDAESDGEVVSGAVFRQFRRGEVDGDVFGGEFEAAVDDGGADAVFAFFDGFFRQADQGHGRQAARKVDFDAHQRRVHAEGGAGVNGGEGHRQRLNGDVDGLRVEDGEVLRGDDDLKAALAAVDAEGVQRVDAFFDVHR